MLGRLRRNLGALGASAGAMKYDMRPDSVGWTIFHVTSGRPVALAEDVVLVGVEYQEADKLVDLLNLCAARPRR